MKRLTGKRGLALIAGVAIASCSCIFQSPSDLPIEVPSFDSLVHQEPALTTSIEDAPTGVPFLDDYDPKGAIIMTALPRRSNGSFVLNHPGSYQFEAKSYCVSPGKRSPGNEGGFLYAPLKGARADIVCAIVERTVKHPDIPQTNVQSLLWAIISRTRIRDLSPELRQAADKLLTRDEIRRLNGGALGLVPDEVLDKAREKLPPAAQQVLEAESRLRELLSDADTTYEELERVAVLAGVAPEDETSEAVPRGRWSFHPDGYFVRYLPKGYSRTCITICVPAPCTIERSGPNGRITSITGFCGRRIEIEYDDSIEPAEIPGAGAMRAYAFRSIRFLVPDTSKDGKPRTSVTAWENTGWTCSGDDFDVRVGDAGAPNERFSGLEERRDWGRQHSKEYSRLMVGVDELAGRKFPSPQVQHAIDHSPEIVQLGHLIVALKDALKDDEQHAAAAREAVELAQRAWMAAVASDLGTHKPSRFLAERHASFGQGTPLPLNRSWRGVTPIRSHSALCTGRSVLVQCLVAQGVLAAPGSDDPDFNPAGGAAAPGGEAVQVVLNSANGTEVAECKANAWKQLEQDVDDAFGGKTGSCDLQSLAQCWKAYTEKGRCFGLHCQDLPDPLGKGAGDYWELTGDLRNALDKWLKADEDCED